MTLRWIRSAKLRWELQRGSVGPADGGILRARSGLSKLELFSSLSPIWEGPSKTGESAWVCLFFGTPQKKENWWFFFWVCLKTNQKGASQEKTHAPAPAFVRLAEEAHDALRFSRMTTWLHLTAPTRTCLEQVVADFPWLRARKFVDAVLSPEATVLQRVPLVPVAEEAHWNLTGIGAKMVRPS